MAGVEPATFRLWAGSSCRLSYTAMVGREGIEPSHLLRIRQAPLPLGYRPVGSGGLEPPASRISGGCSHQMSYEPADAERFERPRPCGPPDSSRILSPIGLRILERRGAGSNPQGTFWCSPVFGTGAVVQHSACLSKPAPYQPVVQVAIGRRAARRRDAHAS
jgi:hypothetical protein